MFLVLPLFVSKVYAALPPWTGLPEHVKSVFSDEGIIYLVGAGGVTLLLIRLGVDETVHDSLTVTSMHDIAAPIYVTGIMGPVLLGGVFYGLGILKGDAVEQGAGLVVWQSALMATSLTTLLKGLTGRSSPSDGIDAKATDFSPGWGRKGWKKGWPSGHVTVTTAILSGLAAYYPEKPWLSMIVPLAAFSMSVAVLEYKNGVHWFSDAFAGALFGIAIGRGVGYSMRKREKKDVHGSRMHWDFTTGPLSRGIGMTLSFEF